MIGIHHTESKMLDTYKTPATCWKATQALAAHKFFAICPREMGQLGDGSLFVKNKYSVPLQVAGAGHRAAGVTGFL